MLRYLYYDLQLVYLLLYVDDIILTGDNSSLMDSFITILGREFHMKDLGIEVLRTSNGLFLTHSKYACDILDRAKMKCCKHISTPMAVKSKLHHTDDDSYSDLTHYRSIVGALQY